MMGYLKWKHNSRLFFDPTYPDIDFDAFNDGAEGKTFYGDVTKAIPPNAPDPRGKSVDLCMWVDSDHAGDKMTWRIVLMIQMNIIGIRKVRTFIFYNQL